MAGSSGSSRKVNLDPSSGGISVARLLFALLRQRFTGTVTLDQREPAGARRIWLTGGMPVFTDWDSPADRLGERLVATGEITAAALERALAAVRSGNGLLGQVLIDLELIDEAARREGLRGQCEAKLAHAFAAGSVGPVAVVEAGEHEMQAHAELAPINVLALILRAVEAHYDEARVEAEMGEALAGDLVATPALARYERQFGFRPEDAATLGAFGRGVTLTRLLKPGVDRRRVLQLAFTLWTCQMLRAGEDATAAIAKGATAAAAGHELGVNLGTQSSGKAPTRAPASKPEPAKPQAEAAPSEPAAKAEPKPAAKPEPKPEPKDDFETQLAELEAKIDAGAHAFDLFAIELDAGRKQVRAAWAELSKAFHPDALEGAGRSALRPRVEQVFAALSEAYGVLSNKEERAKLKAAIESGARGSGGGSGSGGSDTAAVVRNAFEAEIMARDADKLLKASRYARAKEIYARAHELSPKDIDIEAALAYCEYQTGSRDAMASRATIERFEKLLEEAPGCARAHYFKAMIHLRIGEHGPAKAGFAEANKLDPRNIDAQRQLRAIRISERQAKAEAEEQKRGFGLRDLFGGKK